MEEKMKIFKVNGCDILDSGEIIEIIEKSFLAPEDLNSIEPNKLKVIATECAQAFVQNNWLCGRCSHPFVTHDLIQVLNRAIPDPLSYLSPDDRYIPAFARLKNPSLLCHSSSLLKYFDPQNSLEDCLWTIRILITKQMIINEPSNDLHSKLETNIAHLETHLKTLDDRKSVILGYMLACQVYLWYHEIQIALEFLQKAIDLSDLNINLSGRMGRKTKYQAESKSLLNVIITRKSGLSSDVNSLSENPDSSFEKLEGSTPSEKDSGHLPKNVNLMDDTLLTKVKFDEDEDGSEQTFTVILREEEEAIICGLVSYLMTSCGSEDNLVKEEVSTYLDYLIDHCKVWSVVYKCLYLRSLLEREKSRKLDRSMAQLEELVKAVKSEPCSGCSWKLHLFYPVLMDPIWKTEKVLADVFASMGANKSALDIYLELDLWEDIVNCYLRLDRREKAETVVRKKLEEGETPYLLCILGDITNDRNHYLRAWELSERKSSRAQKSLGDYHFFRKEYTEAVPYYVAALEINSTIYSAWSRLAYSALTTEDYSLSAKAYRRVVNFEMDNFEAWNNLSKAYIKLGDKQRAFRTLQESLKCNYDEWRVWENLLLVAMDIAAFDEVIQAWHRLIDIKGKHEDDQLIEILVNSILADLEDSEGEKSSRLTKKVLQLLGRIVATSPGTAKTWKAYAKLSLANSENTDKIVNCLSKSHQACMKQVNWEKEPIKTLEFLENCNELCLHYLSLYEKCENAQLKVQFLSSFRLSMTSFLVIVKRSQNYWENSANREAIERQLKQLDDNFLQFCSLLNL